MLGNPALAGKKALKKMGSPENDVLARKQANEEMIRMSSSGGALYVPIKGRDDDKSVTTSKGG